MENNTFVHYESAGNTDPTSIDEFIEDNFNMTEVNEVDDEVSNIYYDILKDETISVYVDNIITPTTLGLGFFDTSNLFTAINMIIPDLFRRSFVQNPLEFKKNKAMICPTYTRIPLEKFKNIDYSYNNFFQLLLDENILKGFLYFNFSSNPFKMEISDIPFLLLKYRWYDTNPNLSETVNSSNYTTPQTLFNTFYNTDSLLVQLLNFEENMNNSTKDAGTNNTNYPPYFIPWVTSYSCLNNQPDLGFLNINLLKFSINLQKTFYGFNQ